MRAAATTTIDPAAALPACPSSFIGRAPDLAWLRAHVRTTPVVTLVGPGGVGKTRLALEVARLVSSTFADGAHVVELAPAHDDDAVAALAAAALGVRPEPARSLVAGIVAVLRHRAALVVVDNCEHVPDGAGRLVTEVARACPGIRLLVTSRAPLGVDGEHVWPVAPLGPDALELFAARARAASPHTDVTSVAARAGIERICRRLDGIPLALELAAARLQAMSLAELADHLDAAVLGMGSRRGRVARHRTLADAIAWSHRLLTDDERVVFDRLGVFDAGFASEDAAAVCADADLAPGDIPSLVTALVDQSMVVADVDGERARFRLLATLREFALAQLADRDELERRRSCHLRHYAAVITEAGRRYRGPEYASGAATIVQAWGNARLAIHHARSTGDLQSATAILEATFYVAFFGARHEHGEWAEHILALDPANIVAAGVASFWRCFTDIDSGVALARDATASAPDAEAPETELAWLGYASATFYAGRRDEARGAVEALGRVLAGAGTAFATAIAGSFAADILSNVAPAEALAPALEAERCAAALRHRPLLAWATASVGHAETARGRIDRAAARYQQASELAADGANELVAVQIPLWRAVRAPAPARAAAYHDALLRLHAAHYWTDAYVAIESVAAHLVAEGHHDDGAVLIGHLHANARHHTMLAARTREAAAALDERSHHRLAVGAAMDRDEIVAFTLERLRAAMAAGTAAREDASPLTEQERAVCLVVGHGATTRQAASALGLSPKTIAFHLGNAYRKLGVANRAQLARIVATMAPDDRAPA